MYKINDSLIELQQKKQRSDFVFIIFLLVAALLISSITLINNNLIKSVYVSGDSMKPTLYNGDVLFMDINARSKNGDIIVIEGEKKNDVWIIKRQIAVGQKDKKVVVEIKDGRVFVDGKMIYEPYLPSGCETNYYEKNIWILEEDEIFYLGDNRGNSTDSRLEYDTCTRDQVVGVVKDWALEVRWLSKVLYNVGEFFRNLF